MPQAHAGGGSPQQEPLPAREVERPLVMPHGWVEARTRWSREPGVPISDVTSLSLRAGLHGFDLVATLPVGVLGGTAMVLPWQVEVQGTILRREPPNLSVAWRGTLQLPSVRDQAMATRLDLGLRRQWGPTRLTVWAGAGVGLGPVALQLWSTTTMSWGVQLGPIFLDARAEVGRIDPEDATWRWEAGGQAQVQLSRGVDLTGGGGASGRLDEAGASPRGWLSLAVRR